MGTPLSLSQVPAQTPYIQYVATSNQTVFPYPFSITQDSDLVCVINGVTQATDQGYTLSGQGNPTGGNLTFTLGQSGGTIVTLFRNIAIQRITQIGQNSGYSSSQLNAEYNNVYLILQQLQESIALCLQVPNTNSPGPVTTLTPGAYANKYLSFDSNGNPQPAVLTSVGTLTQAILSGLLNPQTPGEAAANVVPSNLLYFGGPGYNDVARYAGADPTGTSDSTAAFDAAARSLGTAGGVVYFRGAFLIDNNLTLPDNVSLVGYEMSPGQNRTQNGDYTPTKFASTLIINGAKTIQCGSRQAIKNCMVINKNLTGLGTYPTPFANATVATNAVAAFSGTPFTPANVSCDFVLENLLVLGFASVYDATANNTNNRPRFARVYFDCTSGIKVANVFDIGRAENCHAWEFLTTNQSYTTDALITRTGTAFYTGPGSTWMRWTDCFAYGWAVGHDINGVQDVRHVSCGADGPATSQPGSGCVGFLYRGSIGNASNVQPQCTQLADTCIRLNESLQNNVAAIAINGGVFHGNNSANGYIDVQAGNYSIIDATFIDNSSVGHIKLESGAGAGTVVAPHFMNGGGNPPIYGDAGALARCVCIGENYMNTTGVVACGGTTKSNTWTPVISFGGASVGITYSVQAGTYTRIGRKVTCTFQLIFTSKGSSNGAVLLTGLPFTVSNTPAGVWSVGASPYYLAMASLTSPPIISPAQNTTQAAIYHGGATGITQLTDANFTNTTTLYGRFDYEI